MEGERKDGGREGEVRGGGRGGGGEGEEGEGEEREGRGEEGEGRGGGGGGEGEEGEGRRGRGGEGRGGGGEGEERERKGRGGEGGEGRGGGRERERESIISTFLGGPACGYSITTDLATSTASMVSSVELKSSISAFDIISMKAVPTFGSSVFSWLTAAVASSKPIEPDELAIASARASTSLLSSSKSKVCA